MAPGYFPTGLIKTFVHTALSKVATAKSRKRLQHHILCPAVDSGLVTNGLFLFDETSSINGMRNSMSMSTLFTVFLDSAHFLRKFSNDHGKFNNASRLQNVFQKCIAA